MSKREKSVNALEGPVTEISAEFPERHILVKCPGCKRVIDQAKFAENLDVCPRCGRERAGKSRCPFLPAVFPPDLPDL